MNRIRTLIAVLALAISIPAALLLAGCGGNNEDPAQVLADTFGGGGEQASSGNLDLSLSGSAEGEVSGNVSAEVSGPFQTNSDDPSALPQLDWTGTFDAEANGMRFGVQGSLIVTDDNAYIEYGGKTYEVGTEAFAQFADEFAAAAASSSGETEGLNPAEAFKQACGDAIEAEGGDASKCDFDFASWTTNLENEGTEDVDGTDTIHISGDLNIQKILTDVVGLGASVGPSGTELSPELIQSQLGPVLDAVDEASFDVYTGEEDKTLRKIEFTLKLDLSGIPMEPGQSVDSATLTFSAAIGDLNEPQTITAPTGDILPISELAGDSESDIGGLLGTDTPSTGSGSSSGSGSGSGATDCLSEAQTEKEFDACIESLSL